MTDFGDIGSYNEKTKLYSGALGAMQRGVSLDVSIML